MAQCVSHLEFICLTFPASKNDSKFCDLIRSNANLIELIITMANYYLLHTRKTVYAYAIGSIGGARQMNASMTVPRVCACLTHQHNVQ